ncbi:MAG: ribosomal RNA small subunit methyltransferase A [Planctomycetota bacterium]|nr:MAG: ribosomal RNA small subunit methyltransferase A [Planctomycetota bacterium]
MLGDGGLVPRAPPGAVRARQARRARRAVRAAARSRRGGRRRRLPRGRRRRGIPARPRRGLAARAERRSAPARGRPPLRRAGRGAAARARRGTRRVDRAALAARRQPASVSGEPTPSASGAVPRPPPGLRELRGRLEPRGFRPSRRLGQNFLVDSGLLARIAEEARIESGELVLEIGPGSGFLTRELLARAERVLAVELDPLLCAWLRETLGEWLRAVPPDAPRFELVEGDALAGKHALAPELDARLARAGAWRVVANLPYSAASPLIVLLGRHANPPRGMSVLVQAEVAERLAAPPASTARGPLSARVQADWEVTPGRHLPPGAFWPAPEIDSQVVHLAPRAQRLPSELRSSYDALVDRLFQQRRKTIRAALRGWGRLADPERALAEVGLAPDSRPEILAVEALERLAERLSPA